MSITQAITKKLQCADHEIIEIRMIRTLNEDSPSKNTPGDSLKRGRQSKKTKKSQRRILDF